MQKATAKETKVVIIGNGFGGTYTLKNLQKLLKNERSVRLTLVGEKNYFLFTPLLHEVATGGINPENIIEPIRKVFRACLDDFYLGKAKKINLKNKTVEIENAKENTTLKYDYLVLAGGAETNFYDILGAKEHSLTLKTLEDAIKIKNRIITQIERASHIRDQIQREKVLHFAVVGGGATGVELAAELVEILTETFSAYYREHIIKSAKITLIQKASELLPQFAPKVRRKSLEVLKRKGVKVILGTGVSEVDAHRITLDDGAVLETENVFWVAGIKPVQMNFDQSVAQLPGGRIQVDTTLALPNHPEVFTLGDIAAVRSKDSYLPALAQVAEKEAKTIASNIYRLIKNKQPKPFKYRSTGNMISLGQWMAVGEVGSFIFSGRATWWLWRTVYLSKMISWQKKVKIAVDWTMAIFSPRDISQL